MERTEGADIRGQIDHVEPVTASYNPSGEDPFLRDASTKGPSSAIDQAGDRSIGLYRGLSTHQPTSAPRRFRRRSPLGGDDPIGTSSRIGGADRRCKRIDVGETGRPVSCNRSSFRSLVRASRRGGRTGRLSPETTCQAGVARSNASACHDWPAGCSKSPVRTSSKVVTLGSKTGVSVVMSPASARA